MLSPMLTNPISDAEFRYQRYVIHTSRAGGVWIALAAALLLPGMITAIAVISMGLLHIDPSGLMAHPIGYKLMETGIIIMLVMGLAMYLVVTLVTLGLAARSIQREQHNHTWDTLLLTSMTPAQIVLGKWWGSLRALNGDHVMVWLLRLGLVAWLSFVGGSPAPPNPFHLLLALLAVVVFSALDSALSVIVGMMPPVSGNHPVVITLALGLRLAVSTALIAFCVVLGLNLHEAHLTVIGLSTGLLLLYAIVTGGLLWLAIWMTRHNYASRGQPASS